MQLHKPTANLSLYQGGVYYVSIKSFNTLSALTAELVNEYLHYQHEVKIDCSPTTKAL